MNPVWSKWYTWTWSVSSPLIGQIITMLASDWLRGGESWPLHASERNIIIIFTPCQHFADQFHFLNYYRKIFNTLFDPIHWLQTKIFNHQSFFLFPRITRLNGLDCIIRLWSMAYGFEIILIKFTHGIIRSLELSLILVRQSRFVMNEYTILLIAVFSKMLCHCTQDPQSTAACK